MADYHPALIRPSAVVSTLHSAVDRYQNQVEHYEHERIRLWRDARLG
jgi:hypothetical protein